MQMQIQDRFDKPPMAFDRARALASQCCYLLKGHSRINAQHDQLEMLLGMRPRRLAAFMKAEHILGWRGNGQIIIEVDPSALTASFDGCASAGNVHQHVVHRDRRDTNEVVFAAIGLLIALFQ